MPPLPTLLHLTASPCFGGPERQMLELGRELASAYRSVYATFREEERCWDFVKRVRDVGYEALVMQYDTPRLVAVFRELVQLLRRLDTAVLVCHGYKAGIIGRLAARRVGIPVIAVSRGWTGESFRVRVFDWLDRLNLRWMDCVVCVSEGQATKIRRTGVSAGRLSVIRNAIRTEKFQAPDENTRARLQQYFPQPRTHLVAAAGRLSPEKGFEVLVDAAHQVVQQFPKAGFVLFGDGPRRQTLGDRIAANNLQDNFVLPGFTDDLDRLWPNFDLAVLSSYTEGLPNVLLEACAAGVPVVTTNVGGTSEIIDDGRSGWLVPPGDPVALATRIIRLLGDQQQRQQMGRFGQQKCRRDFSFAAQASAYQDILRQLSLVRVRVVREKSVRSHLCEAPEGPVPGK